MSELGSRIRADLNREDPHWPAQLAALLAIVLYLLLPGKLTIGPNWLVPAIEAALFIALFLATPGEGDRASPVRQKLATALLVVLVVVTLVGLGILAHQVTQGGAAAGEGLLQAGGLLWATLVLVFAVVYWELDRGGPLARAHHGDEEPPDFLFPQQSSDEQTPVSRWRPTFLDYFYVAVTNSTAFSPTDTMPLTHRAKVMMSLQAVASMVTVILLIARAVNSIT